MRPADGALRHGSFREKLDLVPAPRWVVRVGLVVLAGIVIYGALTQLVAPWERVLGIALGVGVPGLLLTVHGRATVSDGVLRLNLFPFWRTTLALREVATLDRIQVRPLAQMGVLGLGHIEGATVLALRPGEAVRVTMRDDRRYAVVVQHPDALLAAVRAARPDL